MDRSNNRTSYFINDHVITFRKRRRFKLRKALTQKQALILTLGELSIDQALIKSWKYNAKTGWVSVILQ